MLPGWGARRHPIPLGPDRVRPISAPPQAFPPAMRKQEERSEWWIVDGEVHEIGDHVPPRERFVIPRDNIPNKRRKQLRDQFMRRTRLVLKETEHEPWCKRYMELYQELRENWERLYWDEGYSKKIAQDRANYESAEDDDHDSLCRGTSGSILRPYKDNGFGSRQGDTWEKVNQIRDKFEYERERQRNVHEMNSRRQPFDAQRYFSDSERE